jgi:hypothetical protein
VTAEPQITITASGQVLTWCQDVRERMVDDDDAHNLQSIPFEVSSCPPVDQYKRILTGHYNQ